MNGRAQPGHAEEDGVVELGPASTGSWLVTTHGTRHVFDLDASLYTRLPGEGRARFPYDGEPMPLTRVEVWPRVGRSFYIWLDDPATPDLLEHWRISSTVRSIQAVGPLRGPSDDDARGLETGGPG